MTKCAQAPALFDAFPDLWYNPELLLYGVYSISVSLQAGMSVVTIMHCPLLAEEILHCVCIDKVWMDRRTWIGL